ncbi:right-handed parallel beta-helix repeat-containing protein [Candidatus Eisenbacteria bacterium]|uniref:Right-handed parallel beta-helix repeat-containing protein n=1 Tax=Eiseniibacteriota bacterium TaxID=2212470 RepID=A0ABV6YKT2_UNCEI
MAEHPDVGYREFVTWIVFGDPSLYVRTKAPDSMTVSHAGQLAENQQGYLVEVPWIEGALCALYADTTLYGSVLTDAAGNGLIALDSTPLAPDTLLLTVTASNKVTYIDTVLVTQPTCIAKPDGSGDYATIQGAIDSVEVGTVIGLANGVFTGEGNRNLKDRSKAIKIMSLSGNPEQCIIDCQSSERDYTCGFFFQYRGGRESILSGITIRNAWGGGVEAGGAILCFHSSPTIVNCVLSDNVTHDPTGEWGVGGAMFCYEYAAPAVANCVFMGNSSNCGGGLFCDLESSPTITDCIFTANSADSLGGAIMCVRESSPTIANCLFLNNSADSLGGAIVCLDSSPTISHCTFAYNVADAGAGILVDEDCAIAVESTIIAYCAEGEAIACMAGECTVQLDCCDVYANAGGDYVGPISDMLGFDGNISQDPSFCMGLNPELPYTVSGDSPCAPYYNPVCGVVGSRPMGCEWVDEWVDVQPPSGEANARRVLLSVEPNPSSGAQVVEYQIGYGTGLSSVSLNIFDASGRLVRELAETNQSPGVYRVAWDGNNRFGDPVDAGLYFCRLRSGGVEVTRTLVVVK